MDLLDLIVIFSPFVVCAIFICYIVYKGAPKNSRYSSLNYWSDLLLFAAIVIIGILAIITTDNKRSRVANDDYVSMDSSLSIEEYLVTMDVDKDYNIKVTEDITVNFYDNTHHGIYRFVPEWLQYTNKEGKTDSRKAILSDLEAVDQPYVIDVVNKKKRIKIGDADTLLKKGQYKYRIKYNYDMNGDIYDGYDEFIFHAFGDYWTSQIKKPTIIINMPGDVDKEKIHFFADKKREKEITDYINLEVIGNTIRAEVKDDYALYKALTIDIELPDGYFTSEEATKEGSYGYLSMIICIICIVFMVVSFVIWFFKGKDYRTGIETVEFYPPEGLDPSEVGYLYKLETGRKLAVATIVSLAAKGAVKIDESPATGDITVTKNYEIDLDSAINRVVVFRKEKDFDKKSPDYSEETKNFINKYFYSSKAVEATVVNSIDSTLEAAEPLIKKGYISIKSDTINDYTDEAIKNIKESVEKKNKLENELSTNERLVFDALFEKDSVVKLKEHKTLYKVFNEVSSNVDKKYGDLVNELSSYKWTIIVSLWLVVCIVLWGFAYCLIKDLNPKFSYLYRIAYIANIISLVFTMLMRRKTLFGEELLGRIRGFRHYIETAEKDKLEMLVEENPNYFYDILPYAYVLNVTRKWVKKFENIPLPERDMGSFNYLSSSSLDYVSSNFYSPSSSSGSAGGCGGGCSSCGGGCSSCGGGGGW